MVKQWESFKFKPEVEKQQLIVVAKQVSKEVLKDRKTFNRLRMNTLHFISFDKIYSHVGGAKCYHQM
jgi:hypothetical protein